MHGILLSIYQHKHANTAYAILQRMYLWQCGTAHAPALLPLSQSLPFTLAASQHATPIFPPAFSIAMLALPSSSFNRGLSQRPGEGDTSSTRLAHLFLYTGDWPVHRVSRPFAIASSSSTLVCYRDRLRPVCVRERVFVYRRLCVCLRVCVRA